MKRNLLGMCLVALLACAGTAWADLGVVAQDDAGNYTPESFNSGANEGTGFGPWETVFCNDDQSTIYAGATIVTSCADESALTSGQAFALYANGADGAEIQFRRPFATALDDGQAFSVVVSPNYRDGTKGLKFMGAWEGKWYLRAEFFYNNDGYFYKIDGDENATSLGWDYGIGAITVTLEKAADGSGYTLSFARGEDTVTKEGITFPGTVDGVQFYSWQGGTGDENNLVFNSLAIEQVANPPDDRLSLEGDGFVVEYTSELSLKVLRTKSEGTLDVTLDSSYSEFVSVPVSVTISGGDTEATFGANAMLRGNANSATITASADGFAIAKKEIKGPNYSCTAYEAGVEHPEVLVQGGTRDFYVNNLWKEGWAEANNNKVSLRSTDQSVVKITRIGNWQEDERGSYSKCEISAVGPGEATVEVSYDGPKMCEYKFTVLPPFQLSGPATAKMGETKTYTLKAAVDMPTDCSVSVSAKGDGTAEVAPDTFQVDPSEAGGDGFVSIPISVTFNKADDFTLTVNSVPEPPQYTASLDVTVSEPADYSSFIAYDEASFYGDDFDSAALGEGTDKFQAWEEVTKNSGGVFIAGSASDASVLTEGKAFGIWANGADDAELQLRRPFKNSLGDGQAFSVVVSPNYRDGTKGVKFMGYDAEVTHEWWQRAEFFYNNDGYFYKLEGDADATSLDWAYGTDAITITLQKAADGSSHTLSFARGEEVVTKDGITSFGGTIDAVQFYSYKGGDGDENNFIFNSLAIKQVEEPIATRLSLEGDWAVTAASAELAITVVRTTSEGTLDVTLASSDGDFASVPTTVTFADGATEIPVLVKATLKGNGNSATITASAEGYVSAKMTIKGPEYSCNAWDKGVAEPWKVAVGGERTFWVNNANTQEGFPGDDALVTVASTDESIVKVGSLAEWQVGEDGKAYTSCKVTGVEEGTAAVKVYYDGVEMTDYGFTAQIGGEPIPVKAISVKDGEMTLSLDGKGSQIFFATEVIEETRAWNWAPMDIAIIGDGTSVTVPMDAPFMIFKVE